MGDANHTTDDKRCSHGAGRTCFGDTIHLPSRSRSWLHMFLSSLPAGRRHTLGRHDERYHGRCIRQGIEHHVGLLHWQPVRL
jgi:hypothetical protein